MKLKYLLFFFCACIFTSCAVVPIVKPVKYYSPRPYAEIVDCIPKETIYIGTVKIVPRGDAWLRSNGQKQYAIRRLQKSAAKAGADYVVIFDIKKSNKDYFFDLNYSDGYTIMGEMFRLVE